MEFTVRDSDIIQTFSYDKRNKNKKYLLEPCYILYNKFEAKLRELSLQNDSLSFFKRVNDEGKVDLYYYILENLDMKQIDLNRKMFKLVDFTPPNPGCEFCIFKQDLNNDLFFRCDIKNRTMSKEVKSCKVFKQKRLYKT